MTQKTPSLTPVQTTVLSQSTDDLGTFGVVVGVDPDEADEMGAFEEDALTLADVEASEIDGQPI
ncbi:hypothetical protein V8J38_16900 (plasmid) [Brevundimonas olei]|uniref:Benenodin family lasso peptide n=1 Tax=Brevundimonas olei TaxID=657642 RepID=A0ABZ2IJP7_9CAUL